MKFETRAIHVGQDPDPATGAVAVPIYQTSTFAQEAVGVNKGYDYSRVANPTRSALEAALASLEGARHCLAFASGLAAEDAVARLLAPGDHVLLGEDVYGGTRRLFEQVLHDVYRCTSVDMGSPQAVAAAMTPATRMVWVETPTNPYLRLADIAALAGVAHATGALLVADNTFATPYLQRPLELGADIVVHSTTKYLGGHSDVVGGAALTSDDALARRLAFLRKATGGVPGPFDAWLVLRGLKTLALRMERHCANAAAVAGFLEGHPAVMRVWFPGLPGHPGHALAARQMDGFGGMISFELGSREEALAVVSRTRLFFLAESLGGVESLIEHPAAMTHAGIAGSPFAVSDRLIRISVGIEAAEDLIADLARALSAAGAGRDQGN